MTDDSIPIANPFAPPQARVADVAPPSAAVMVPASRLSRVGALLVDQGVGFVIGAYGIFANPAISRGADAEALRRYGIVMLVCALVMLVMGISSLVMFYRTGQSIGKRLFGIRVVRADGSRMAFGRALLLRWIAPGVVFSIPSWIFTASTTPRPETWWPWLALAVSWSGLAIDHVFVLARDRRCLHDLMADSCVATAASTPAATLDGASD